MELTKDLLKNAIVGLTENRHKYRDCLEHLNEEQLKNLYNIILQSNNKLLKDILEL